jgi:hypothetical protein
MAEIPPEDDTVAITVDVAGLADFSRELRTEIESHLRLYLTELVTAYQAGPGFGRQLTSPNVSAARSHYTDCLLQMISQLTAVGNAGLVLAEAAALIAQRYGDADALAAASVGAVNDAVALAGLTSPGLPALSAEPETTVLYGHEVS